jgi:RNA polymerase sigma-70 factor (ECF subfamily)
MSEHRFADRFPTTHWSRVVAAGDGAAPEARDALAELCRAYWYPLYAFVRRKGHGPEDAQDLVQGFFASLLEHNGLATLDRDKGRFRSFLIAACSHYLCDEIDRRKARKRGGGRVIISIDGLEAEGRYESEPAHELTAERLYQRRWATTLLERVLNSLEVEMHQAGKGRLLEALRPALLGEAGRVPYARIAEELGLSEGAARAAAHRFRSRYRTLLHEEVARTVAGPEAVAEEVRDLFAALAR